MPSIHDLGLNDEPRGLDFNAMPTGMGSRPVTPQPGIYKFRLPSEDALFNAFDVIDDGTDKILQVKFRDEAMLFNVSLNNWYSTNVNNRIRSFKRGEDNITFSDLSLLIAATKVPVPDNPTDTDLANALVSAAGKEFMAEHTLSTACSSKRDVYRDGKTIPGLKGCGLSYSSDPYTKKDGTEVLPIPKDAGALALRFTCSCGAELRAWANLRGFRSA